MMLFPNVFLFKNKLENEINFKGCSENHNLLKIFKKFFKFNFHIFDRKFQKEICNNAGEIHFL